MAEKLDKIKNDLAIDGLVKLGLSEKEALVYTALLGLGEVGSSKIIKAAGLHGQYVYQALGGLEGKGLIQHVIERGRKRFSAKHPKALVRLLEGQKHLADEVVEALEARLVLPPEQSFEVFQGKESYVAHEFELLEQVQDGDVLLVIGGTGNRFFEMLGDELGRYESVRLKKKILVRYIGSDAERETLLKQKYSRELFEYRLLPGLFTGMVNTNIWPEVVGFNIFGEPVMSFMVSNPIIAGSYGQFFETLWKLGKS